MKAIQNHALGTRRGLFFYLITHASKQKTPQKGTAGKGSRNAPEVRARTVQRRGRRA